MTLNGFVNDALELADKTQATHLNESSAAFYQPYSARVWDAAVEVVKEHGSEGSNEIIAHIVLLREQRYELLRTSRFFRDLDKKSALDLIEASGSNPARPEFETKSRREKAGNLAEDMISENQEYSNRAVQIAEHLRHHICLLTTVLKKERGQGSLLKWKEMHSSESLWARTNFLKFFSGFREWSKHYSSFREMMSKNGLGGHGSKKKLWEGIIRHMPPEEKSALKESVDEKIKVSRVRKAFERAPAFGYAAGSDVTLFQTNESVETTVERLFETAKMMEALDNI